MVGAAQSQRTALHVAIACDAPDTAVYLLENGARMDVKDEVSSSALSSRLELARCRAVSDTTHVACCCQWGSSPMECARNAAMRQTLLPYKVRLFSDVSASAAAPALTSVATGGRDGAGSRTCPAAGASA